MSDLFTLAELASLLQVSSVDNGSGTLARELATGLIEDEIGPIFSTTSTVVLPINGDGTIDLPFYVVTAVASVDADDLGATFEWERPYRRLRLCSWTPSTTRSWHSASVTLTHGWVTPPVVLKAVGLSAAKRIYDNPQSLRTEQSSLDDHSETLTRAGSDEDLSGIGLTDTELRRLDPYRVGAYVTGS